MKNSGFNLSTPLKRSSRTLAEQVVDALVEPIHSGQLKPGDKLPTESEIVQQFGVSRTVVREAISRLQARRVVETRHGIGTFVSEPQEYPVRVSPTSVNTAIDAVALLEVRIAIEVEAAILATQRHTSGQLDAIKKALDDLVQLETSDNDVVQEAINADFAFHQSIAIATNNAYFLEYLVHLGKSAIPRSRLTIVSDTHKNYLQTLNQEHRQIYLAIAAQDPGAAAEAVRSHLQNSQQRLSSALKAQNS